MKFLFIATGIPGLMVQMVFQQPDATQKVVYLNMNFFILVKVVAPI